MIVEENGRFFLKKEITQAVIEVIKKLSNEGMIEYRGSDPTENVEERNIVYDGIGLGLIEDVDMAWHESYQLTKDGKEFYKLFIGK